MTEQKTQGTHEAFGRGLKGRGGGELRKRTFERERGAAVQPAPTASAGGQLCAARQPR